MVELLNRLRDISFSWSLLMIHNITLNIGEAVFFLS